MPTTNNLSRKGDLQVGKRNKGSSKQKLREFTITRLALQEMHERVLQAEIKKKKKSNQWHEKTHGSIQHHGKGEKQN